MNLVKHDQNVLSQYFALIGRKGARKGGLARAKALTPARRREIALKASRAAAKARRAGK